METPFITVLMPVKSGAKYLREAIDSVLQQTYTCFELLIIDEGSTGETAEIVRTYPDSRIRLERGGPDFAGSLNRGLQLAAGKYIARMDVTHIMHSERLRIQQKRMELDPEITVLSSQTKLFKDDGTQFPCGVSPQEGRLADPLLDLLRYSPVVHSAAMIRKSFLDRYQLSYQHYEGAEDDKLWLDIAVNNGIFFIEPRPLLFYRLPGEPVAEAKKEMEQDGAVRIKEEALTHLLARCPEDVKEHTAALYLHMAELEKKKLLTKTDLFGFFYSLFSSCT